MESVRSEIALANAQELMNVRLSQPDCSCGYKAHLFFKKTNEKCFAKCIPKPANALSSSEEVRSFLIDYFKSAECYEDVSDKMSGTIYGCM